jgi:hypothetical protein
MIAYYIDRAGKLIEFENSDGYEYVDMILLQDNPLAAWRHYSTMKLAELNTLLNWNRIDGIDKNTESRIAALNDELARVNEKLVESLSNATM